MHWLYSPGGDQLQGPYPVADLEAILADSAAILAALLAGRPAPPVRPDRVARSLYAIVQDLDALTPADQAAIWAQVTSGIPPAWTTSNNLAVWVAIRVADGLAEPHRTSARIAAVAAYTRDEAPTWLVHPAWRPTLNVPGDEPV
jgi:hypothetical protein